MRSINIAILAQLCGNEGFSAYENMYSRRSKRKNTSAHEQETLKDMLVQLGSDITFGQLEGFYFSYSIPQISKEFDLLRITDDAVLDIELKSDTVAEAKIHKQLVRNKYYLGHFERTIYLFTYVKGGRVYTLDEQNHLAKTTVLELKNIVKQTQKTSEIEDIDQFFKPSRFLISPLNTPERFLKGDYFLTDQQEEYKNAIIDGIEKKKVLFGLTGRPGTGKTLLLYDIARELSKKYRCLIVHCAPLSQGHEYLSKHLENCCITTPKDFMQFQDGFLQSDVFLFDEFQRAYENVFDVIKAITQKAEKRVIISFDFGQMLSHAEEDRNLLDKLNQIKGMQVLQLSDKIRTNKEIDDFTKKLFMPKKNASIKPSVYPHVTVLYSSSRADTLRFVESYKNKGFTFINHSVSLHVVDSFDTLNEMADSNSHRVIGQEFDKVLVVMNEKFYYDNGVLTASRHANPDYLFTKLLYQEVTRTRNELCIIVENNLDVLTQIMSNFLIEE